MKKERQQNIQLKNDEIAKLLAEITKEKNDREETKKKLQQLSEQSRNAKEKTFKEEVLITQSVKKRRLTLYHFSSRRRMIN